MKPEDVQKLRAPFPKEHVGQLTKGGTKIDFVGHAAVTSRLLEIDPEWNWEPVATDEHGLPLFSNDGTGLWIKLTLCGVTRLGYGSIEGKAFEPEKELIGDAIRNAAMRFGVALDLWIKGQEAEATDRPKRRAEKPKEPEAPALPEGWETPAAMEDAHKDFTDTIAKANDATRTAMREYRKTKGFPFPMTGTQLAQMWEHYFSIAGESKQPTLEEAS